MNFSEIPEIEVAPRQIAVNASSDVTITCSLLKGSPSPELTWDISEIVSNLTVESSLSEEGRREETLILNDVQVEDSGEIYCLATNEAGRTRRPVTISVYGESSPF